MPREYKSQPGQQAQVLGQRVAALVAGAVVLLLIITFLAMNKNVGLGASPGATPQLPPAKATGFARVAQTEAAMKTQVPAATKGSQAPQAPEALTPTFTSAIIYYDGQDKFPNFNTNDMYRGQVNGTWEFVYVGSDTTTSASGVGAVRIETFSNAGGNQLVGVFDAPDHSTGLDITGITGNVLRIKSDKTASFGFDLATNTFTS